MLVQLDEQTRGRGGVKKKQIKQMVKHYRGNSKPSEKLKYAHFRLEDILDLFVKNQVLHPKIIDLINNNTEVQAHHKNYGVKIYLGKHKVVETCPTDGHLKPEEYLDKVTTIICNTDLVASAVNNGPFKGFKDILSDNDYVLLPTSKSGDPTEPGDGLDQAEICPPFPNADDEIYDIGNDPNP